MIIINEERVNNYYIINNIDIIMLASVDYTCAHM